MSRLVHSEFAVSVEDAIDEWGDAVLRLARRRMGNQADAEDVFQTVFLRLHQNARAINDATHLKSWLLRVTVNCCNDLHRKNNRDTSVPLEDHDAPSEPESDLSLAEQRLHHAVDALPEGQRTAVHLHYFEGYSTKEIAAIAGESPATVRSHLFRARKALKKALEGADDEQA